MTVLVTGATGTVGRHLVTALLAAGHKVRALTRRPETADLPDDVEVVAGDTTDVDSLTAAFAGATAAHLINFGHGYRPLDNGAEIVAAALRAGVGRVTLLGGWAEGTLEPAVRASALEWTQLRPRADFMANTLHDWGPPLRAHGVIREPHGDRLGASVHEADIADVAATALTTDGHAGRTYTLTGPETLTPRDKVRHLADATGLDLRFEELTPEQARALWTAEPPALQIYRVAPGGPAEKADFVLGLYSAVPEAGQTVTDDVERVTGRPGRTFAQWAVEHADAFRRAG